MTKKRNRKESDLIICFCIDSPCFLYQRQNVIARWSSKSLQELQPELVLRHQSSSSSSSSHLSQRPESTLDGGLFMFVELLAELEFVVVLEL